MQFQYPVPTIDVLDWIKKKIEDIDIKSRKTLTQTGSFHKNSSLDHLYSCCKEGGCGLSCVADIFTSRTVAISEHLREQIGKHKFLTKVRRHETERIVKMAEEFYKATNVTIEEEPNLKKEW